MQYYLYCVGFIQVDFDEVVVVVQCVDLVFQFVGVDVLMMLFDCVQLCYQVGVFDLGVDIVG